MGTDILPCARWCSFEMNLEKSSLIRRGIPLLLIGLFIFLLYLYFFVGITDILVVIQRVNIPYYLLAFASVLASTTFYSLTWQGLLNMLLINAPFRKTFLFTWIGIFVDLLIPAEAISGEISRAYLMSKSLNRNAGGVIASVMGHRVLSMGITLIGLIIGLILFITKYGASGLILSFVIFIGISTTLSLVLICYLFLSRRTAEKMVNWLINVLTFISGGRWQLNGFKSKAQRLLEEFYQGIEVLSRRPEGLIWPVFLSVTAWFFDLFTVFLVFISLGFKIPWSTILIVYSISTAVQTIPLGIPAELGVAEIVMTSLYTILGIPSMISAAATVLVRVLIVWLRLAIGYVAVQWVGIKILMKDVSQTSPS